MPARDPGPMVRFSRRMVASYSLSKVGLGVHERSVHANLRDEIFGVERAVLVESNGHGCLVACFVHFRDVLKLILRVGFLWGALDCD